MINAEIDRETKDAAILIVDDNLSNVDLLREILRHQGYTNVRGETDPRLVPDLCREQAFDILLLDIRMPHLTGFQLIELLLPIFGGDYVPILVLTAQTDQETRRKAELLNNSRRLGILHERADDGLIRSARLHGE